MQRPTKKLWRKIGLQKNFLQGTSHSDQSRNTFSQFYQSLIKQQSLKPNFREETENFIIQSNEAKQKSETSKSKVGVNQQQNLGYGSCETPIKKLSQSNYDGKQMLQSEVEDTFYLINQNKLSGTNFSESIKESLICFQSLQLKEEQGQLYKQVIVQTLPHKPKKDPKQSKESRQYDEKVQDLKSETKIRKTSGDSIKIRLRGVQQKESQTNQTQQVKNEPKSSNNLKETLVQQIYTLQIDPKQLEKYQNIQRQMSNIKKVSVPKLNEILIHVKKYYGLEKSFIVQEMNLMRQRMAQIIKIKVSEQMQQMNDELGYLYSENQQLITKLEEKQSTIKKHHQEYSKLQKQLSQYTQSIRTQQEQKDLKILQLQNEVNKLQQKLQDFEELQAKIENQKQKNQQLENQISVFIQNERNFTELMDQKTFDLSAAIIKNQELQWQVNELHSRNEQLEYNLNKQFAQKIEKLQNQHTNQLKSFEFLVQSLTDVLNESLKHLNLHLIETLKNQFNVQENEYLNQIFKKAIVKTQFPSRTHDFTKDIREIDSNLFIPQTESENQNSSGKNLRMTGYFGQAVEPTLKIRLNDIKQKFSSQTIEDEIQEDLNKKRQTIQQQTKKLLRTDTFSDISEQCLTKEDYAFKTIQPSYPKNYRKQERKWSISQNETYLRPVPSTKDSINLNTHKAKLYLKQKINLHKSGEIPNHFNNQQTYPMEKFSNRNANYSFSELNQNLSELDNDQSSVTTYEKSQNNGRNREIWVSNNNISHQRASTERSQRSEQSTDRQDIIQKIKERVKQKLKSKEKYYPIIHQPTYNSHVQTFKRPSYYDKEHDEKNQIKKQDMILANFYEKNLFRHPVITQNLTERKMSPLTNRSRSKSRSRSPSNSSINRIPNNAIRVGTTKYNPIGTATYATGNQNKSTISVTPRGTFNRSMVQRPQFSTYSKKINDQSTPSQTYQPKSSIYSNRGQSYFGSSYGKKI